MSWSNWTSQVATSNGRDKKSMYRERFRPPRTGGGRGRLRTTTCFITCSEPAVKRGMTRKEVRGLSTSPASGPSPAHSTVWRSRPMSSYNIIVVPTKTMKKSRVRQVQLTKPNPQPHQNITGRLHRRCVDLTHGAESNKNERTKTKAALECFHTQQAVPKMPHTDKVCVLHFVPGAFSWERGRGLLETHSGAHFCFVFAVTDRTVQCNLLLKMPQAQKPAVSCRPRCSCLRCCGKNRRPKGEKHSTV